MTGILLILTNSQDVTADFLIEKLEIEGIGHVRLDTDRLISTAKFRLRDNGLALNLGELYLAPRDVAQVWYRRPQKLEVEGTPDTPEFRYSKTEWSAALNGFLAQIPISLWMNHPSRNALASHKLEQIATARNAGFLVPETLVTQDPRELKQFFCAHQGQVIAKPMASGYVSRENADSVIFTSRVAASDLEDLRDLETCPTLFQQLIDRDCDIRITVVDGEVHAMAMRVPGVEVCDIRRDNMENVKYEPIQLPGALATQLVELLSHYGLRFGAIDMLRSKSGVWYFLELNPNGQWAWMDLAGVSSIHDSFLRAFRA